MDPFLGQIMMFAGNFAPRGWAKCEGQLLPINQYSALFSLLGTTYGGDGRTTFGLPDMRGRVPLAPGNGPGLSPYRQGPGGGHENVALNVTNLPAHNHAATGKLKGYFAPPTGGGNTNNPSGANLSGAAGTNIYSNQSANVEMAAGSVDVTTTNTGGNIPVDVRQPWTSVQFCIALVGIFPPRS